MLAIWGALELLRFVRSGRMCFRPAEMQAPHVLDHVVAARIPVTLLASFDFDSESHARSHCRSSVPIYSVRASRYYYALMH